MIIHHHNRSVCVLNGRWAVIVTKRQTDGGVHGQITRMCLQERELSLCLSGHMWCLLLCIHVGMKEMWLVYVGVVVQQRGPGVPEGVAHFHQCVFHLF